MSRTELLAGLAILEAAAGKAVEEHAIPVWLELMSDLPDGVFLAACKRSALESQFPVLPAMGRIRQIASELLHGVPDSPEVAFERVRQAIRNHGYNQPASAQADLGPAIWSVVEGIGGWSRLCDSPVDQRAALFAQFRDAWKGAVERQVTALRLPPSLKPKPMSLAGHVALRIADQLSVPEGANERG